jgi:hypothetical protein
MTAPAPLQLAEAVPLGYAVLAQVAEDVGVRMLAIKGPILALQGLRTPRQSVDIDVLVEPAGFAALTDGLTAIGWRDDHTYDTVTLMPQHSVNHRHPHWPIEVDVHHWFPGFLADPAEVFDVLWSRRVDVELAHRPLPAPDPVAHAALSALHYLREHGRAVRAADLEALAGVIEREWDPAQRADLVEVAARTGSGETLRPLLTRLDLPVPAPSTVLTGSLEDWRMFTDASVTSVLPWLVMLRRAPWHQKPRFLARALWADPGQLRGVDPVARPRRRDLVRAQWRRLTRALRLLPAALAEERRLRRRRG